MKLAQDSQYVCQASKGSEVQTSMRCPQMTSLPHLHTLYCKLSCSSRKSCSKCNDSNFPVSLDKLSSELLSHILTISSHDRPHVDIANSRRVSRRFHELSPPFMISTVVIANRTDTLRKLRQVLEPPHFYKYVTRLVWDASYCKGDPATTLEDYCGANRNDPFTFFAPINHDKALRTKWQQARDILIRSALDPLCFAEIIEPFPDYVDIVRRLNVANRSPYHREAFHFGFNEYQCRYHAESEFLAFKLSLHYLHLACTKLPKLRYFEFSNHRALGCSGEDHHHRCTRLFGSTSAPRRCR
jgi:hypothetical protein